MGDSIDNYQIYNLVGRGGFAQVYRAKCCDTGEEVAIKMIDKETIVKKRMETRVQKEVEIHSKLMNPHILRVLSYFEDDDKVYLVLEFCEKGELNRFLHARGYPFTEAEAKALIRQIVNGMTYLQKHQILHRDLSLGNMLLTSTMEVKIADFGLATKLEHADEKHFTMCGTPNFISPEIVSQTAHGLEADIFSLGCMIYTLLVGKAPFDTDEIKSTLKRVKSVDFEIPSHVSPLARDLIRSLLRKSPTDRLPLDRVLTHPFFSENGEKDNAFSLSRTQSGRTVPHGSLSSGQQTLGSDGSSGKGSQDSNGIRRSPSTTLVSTQGQATSGYPSTSRSRLRSRDPSPPVRMKSRPDELRGVETSLDRLKYEALRLHPALDPRDKPPLNPPVNTSARWLDDLRRTVESDNRKRNDDDGRRNQLFVRNLSASDDVVARKNSETPVKRTFHNRGTSFEDNDKENDSSSSNDRKRRLLPSSSSSSSSILQSSSSSNQPQPLPASSSSSHNEPGREVDDSLVRVPSIKDAQSNCNSIIGSPGDNTSVVSRRANKDSPRDKPNHSVATSKTCSTSKPSKPLQTSRLRPYRQRHNRSVMSILENGKVCIELLKEEKVKEVLLISSDGLRIEVFRPNRGKGKEVCDKPMTEPLEGDSVQVYQFHELPSKVVGKYNLASDFVQLNRTITPKVTLFGTVAKCMVMESGNSSDYQLAFYDGSQLISRAKSGVKLVESDGTTVQIPGSGAAGINIDEKIWKHLSEQNREKWTVAQECLQKCHQLESALSGIESLWISSGNSPCVFPAVFGRHPSISSSSSSNCPSTSSLSKKPSTPSTFSPHASDPSPSLHISPSAMPPLPTTLFSHCDSSIVAGSSGGLRAPSKSGETLSSFKVNAITGSRNRVKNDVVASSNKNFECANDRRVNDQRVDAEYHTFRKNGRGDEVSRNEYHDGLKSSNARSNTSNQRDFPQFASSTTTPNVHLPGLCRAFATPSGQLRVDFEDGTRLDVNTLRPRGQDSTMEYIDAAGKTRRFHSGEEFLPGEVKEKLKHLPSVLDRLAGLKL